MRSPSRHALILPNGLTTYLTYRSLTGPLTLGRATASDVDIRQRITSGWHNGNTYTANPGAANDCEYGKVNPADVTSTTYTVTGCDYSDAAATYYLYMGADINGGAPLLVSILSFAPCILLPLLSCPREHAQEY
jgi:hypothetical protein